jgi:hypothetical protein
VPDRPVSTAHEPHRPPEAAVEFTLDADAAAGRLTDALADLLLDLLDQDEGVEVPRARRA